MQRRWIGGVETEEGTTSFGYTDELRLAAWKSRDAKQAGVLASAGEADSTEAEWYFSS